MLEQKLVEIYRAKNTFDAHLVRVALEDDGIRATVSGEAVQMAIGDVPVGWMTSPQVLVLEEDAERARAIVEELEASRRHEPTIDDFEDEETAL